MTPLHTSNLSQGKKVKGKPTHHRVWREEPEVGQTQVISRSHTHGSRNFVHLGRAALSTSLPVNLPSVWPMGRLTSVS